ncbi:Uncharacterized protein HZ326_9240 [Fusarium oxysporum f. sp. albedinis]|nr:Uncharacterized protein HZ326_9240 [Fusarium oxysporum f. sp. albedinis]
MLPIFRVCVACVFSHFKVTRISNLGDRGRVLACFPRCNRDHRDCYCKAVVVGPSVPLMIEFVHALTNLRQFQGAAHRTLRSRSHGEYFQILRAIR